MSRILVPRFARVAVRTWYLVPVTLVLAAGVAHGGTDPKVTICHVPPGNPSNVRLITVGARAVPAHVANHGDAVCAAGDTDCCADRSGEVCTNLQTDARNCGTCGAVCPTGVCSAGSCVSCPCWELVRSPAPPTDCCLETSGGVCPSGPQCIPEYRSQDVSDFRYACPDVIGGQTIGGVAEALILCPQADLVCEVVCDVGDLTDGFQIVGSLPISLTPDQYAACKNTYPSECPVP